MNPSVEANNRVLIDVIPVSKKRAVPEAAPQVVAVSEAVPFPDSFENIVPKYSSKFTRSLIIKFVFGLVVITGLSGAFVYRSALISGMKTLYENAYTAISLRVNPLPPLRNGQLRVTAKQLYLTEQRIESQVISVGLAGATTHPSKQLLSSWFRVSLPKDGQQTLSVNEQPIINYLTAEATVASKQAVDQVTVTHSDGTTATLQSGIDGLKFANVNGLASQIGNSFLKGKGFNGMLPSASVPFSVTNQPTAPKLIEVDIVTKRLYAYQNGQLIQTYLVSAGAPDTPTPTGTFHIWEKLLVQDMKGFNPNGTTYNQPNVQWINYFDHNGDAIHGNYWRPLSYFGNVNSSHGCVGLINSEAEWVYNWAPIGTPVVIHT